MIQIEKAPLRRLSRGTRERSLVYTVKMGLYVDRSTTFFRTTFHCQCAPARNPSTSVILYVHLVLHSFHLLKVGIRSRLPQFTAGCQLTELLTALTLPSGYGRTHTMYICSLGNQYLMSRTFDAWAFSVLFGFIVIRVKLSLCCVLTVV